MGLADALKLSDWETHYLFAASGVMLPDPMLDDAEAMRTYIDALLQPNPALVLDVSWRIAAYNREWQRLFKGVWLTPSMHQWLYVSTTSRSIVRNWDEVSQWCVGWLRYGMAVDPDTVAPVVRMLMSITVFRREWQAQVIPVDPATRPWIVHDRDNGCESTIDMQVWRASPMPGALLLGAILDTR